jgi:hypothetical protein
MGDMPRAKPQEYVLRITLFVGHDIRRFCEVRVRNDQLTPKIQELTHARQRTSHYLELIALDHKEHSCSEECSNPIALRTTVEPRDGSLR